MFKAVYISCICLLPVLFSCKKNYSCACKTTIADTRPPVTIKTSNSIQPINEKMTEQQAASACESIKFQLRNSFSQQLSSDPRVTLIVACELN